MTRTSDTEHRLTPNARMRIDLAERDGGWFCTYCRIPLVPEPYGSPEFLVAVKFYPDGSYSPLYGYRTSVTEHVLPRCRGGSNHISNRVLACPDCNSRKGTKTLDELAPDWHRWRTGEDYEAQRRKAAARAEKTAAWIAQRAAYRAAQVTA